MQMKEAEAGGTSWGLPNERTAAQQNAL